MRKYVVTINIKFGVLSIGIYQNFSKGWTENRDVSKSSRTIQTIESISSIHLKNSFSIGSQKLPSWHGWQLHNQQVGLHTIARTSHLQYIISNNALESNRRQASPIPIGLTPGCLSKAIRQQAVNAERQQGSTSAVANLLATAERAAQSVSEATPNKFSVFHPPPASG